MKDQKQQNKKILMCYHSAEFGGVEKQILDIISGLSDKFDFYVVCPNGPLVEDYLKAGAIEHIDLKPRFELDLGYVLKIRKIIKEKKVDIIHSHELLTGSLATFGAWLAGCDKRIYHVHTPFSQWQHSGWKKYIALVVNTIANFKTGNFFATDVLALTPSVKEHRIKKEFIMPGKITVIPNGVYLENMKFDKEGRKMIRDRYGIKENEIVFGNMSRFTEEKGYDVLLKAYAKLSASDRGRSKVLLAGGGKLLDEMKLLASALKIEDRVIFTNRFSEEEKTAIFSSMDIFVFPTLAEGFGIAMIEAMAIGLPVTASNLLVLKDVGEDAVLYFKKSNSNSLRASLELLLTDSNARENLAKESRKQAQKYSMQSFWKNYIRLYNSN